EAAGAAQASGCVGCSGGTIPNVRYPLAEARGWRFNHPTGGLPPADRWEWGRAPVGRLRAGPRGRHGTPVTRSTEALPPPAAYVMGTRRVRPVGPASPPGCLSTPSALLPQAGRHGNWLARRGVLLPPPV